MTPKTKGNSSLSGTTIPENPDALLNRHHTAHALTEAGYPISPATLATKASRGGGPPYQLFGPRVIYRWGSSLDWAKGRLSKSRTSTSADKQVCVEYFLTTSTFRPPRSSARESTPRPKSIETLETIIKKFSRQNCGGASLADINVDFGAATAKRARVFEPNEYKLRIESARVIQSNGNVLVALDLIETESGGRVGCRPLWVDGPNAGAGQIALENQHRIARLLTLAGLPTAGNVGTLIPQLAGLEFDARLVLDVDNRSGRTYNSIDEIYGDNAP